MKKEIRLHFLFLALLGLWAGMALAQTTTFNYTGAVQTYTAPSTGYYQFEVWGAQGGSGGYWSDINYSSTGGYGGYSTGEYYLNSGDVINIYVGGAGESHPTPTTNMENAGTKDGGWNGGGGNTTLHAGGGGGGASDIRVGGTALSNRVIVAGGGGGGGNADAADRLSNGGAGGGLESPTLPNTTQMSDRTPGTGGTQTTGYSLGIGETSNENLAGGAGGGYYGGTAGDNSTGGGGGSGYIGGVINGATTIGLREGDGQAVITVLCDGLTVTGDPEAPVCPGTSITLEATSTNGGTVTWDNGISNGVAFTAATTTTYTATSDHVDDCEATVTITVEDNDAPVPDAGTLADVTAECLVDVAPTAPTATDACVGSITGTTDATFPITAQGTTTITWTYDDGNGNTSTQTQDIVIDDVTDPVPDVADLPTVYNQCVATVTAPTATDNCAGTITASTADPTTYDVEGDYTITWTYNDGNGNTTTQTQDVALHDVFVPVADLDTLPVLTDECVVNIADTPVAWDNCDGLLSATTDDPWSYSGEGSYIHTWVYTDAQGNESTQLQAIIIDDVTDPIPDAADLSDLTGECSVAAPTAPTATDNCEGSITGTTDATFPITASTTITWTYDDGNGNTATQTQDVVISDAVAPVADEALLSDVTAECSVDVAPTAPTATDNCAGAITGTTDAVFPITAQGTTTITWTYDDGNGNTSTQTQDIVIDDVTDPVPDVADLPDLTDECSVAEPAAPTATDNCSDALTATTDVVFPVTAQGTTTITWTYDDGNGNTATQTQDVVIDDVTDPEATCPADVVTCDGTVNSIALTGVSDNCTTPTVTYQLTGATTGIGTGDASGETFAVGVTTVTYTIDDGNGNTIICDVEVDNQDIGTIDVAETGGTITVSTTGDYQWMNCADDSEITGETGSTFAPTATGDYAVIVTTGECSDTSACVPVSLGTGLSKHIGNEFTYKPNPVTNELSINLGTELSNVQITVIDLSGQVVRTEDKGTISTTLIDMSDLQKGIYMVLISSDQGSSLVRIIKK